VRGLAWAIDPAISLSLSQGLLSHNEKVIVLKKYKVKRGEQTNCGMPDTAG